MKRGILFFALAGLFSVNAMTQNEVKFYTFPDEGAAAFYGFSSNGRYVVGNTNTMAVCYDRQENKLMMTFDPSTDYPENEARGISNEAVICGKSTFTGEKGNYMAPGVFNFTDSTWTALPLDKDTGSDTYCNANAITGNGRFAVGNTPGNESYLRACAWNKEGKDSWENSDLILLPLKEDSYVDIARAVSDDGTLIGGVIKDAMYGYPALWKNGELIDLSENSTCSGSIEYISRNGKYAGGNKGEYMARAGEYMPFIWHSETEEITPVQVHEGASGGVVNGISEDGKIIAGYSMFEGDVTVRKPFIIIDGEFNDLDEYMVTLGWEVPEEYQEEGYDFSFFTVAGMSPSGTALCGMADVGYKLGWIIEFDPYTPAESSVESVSQSSLSVYPNPVKDKLYIQGDCLSATVYNQAGVSVLSSNSVMEYLDMSNLEKGVYYVKLVGEKETATKKVMVK